MRGRIESRSGSTGDRPTSRIDAALWGSTEAMQVSVVIGVGEKDWPDLAKKFPELSGKISYPVGLAYYLGEDNDGTPDQEQFFQLYDNGVLGALNLSLGAIKIRAVLDSLQLQSGGGC